MGEKKAAQFSFGIDLGKQVVKGIEEKEISFAPKKEREVEKARETIEKKETEEPKRNREEIRERRRTKRKAEALDRRLQALRFQGMVNAVEGGVSGDSGYDFDEYE